MLWCSFTITLALIKIIASFFTIVQWQKCYFYIFHAGIERCFAFNCVSLRLTITIILDLGHWICLLWRLDMHLLDNCALQLSSLSQWCYSDVCFSEFGYQGRVWTRITNDNRLKCLTRISNEMHIADSLWSVLLLIISSLFIISSCWLKCLKCLCHNSCSEPSMPREYSHFNHCT